MTTRVTFGSADITDMVHTVRLVPPWLSFSWSAWEDIAPSASPEARERIERHRGHALRYRSDGAGSELHCLTCERAAEVRQDYSETLGIIAAARRDANH